MTNVTNIKPFEKGDIFAATTILNNPEDDHAGEGRIIQFDSGLNEKGVLVLKGTTHLISGLKFSPDGVLWIFDSQAHKVVRIDKQGRQLPEIDFPKRAFSNANFAVDGSVYLGEHVVGNIVKLPPGRAMNTTIPFLPGTDRFGDGHVFHCAVDGRVLKEFFTQTHGGLPGFLGVTCAVLSADGKMLTYLSELGNRVMRYDLGKDSQLPDLITFGPESGDRAMTLAPLSDGTLLLIRANFKKGFDLNILGDDGSLARTIELPGPGWATLAPCVDGKHIVLGNFFNGALIKMDLALGEVVSQVETKVERALAGLAEFPG